MLIDFWKMIILDIIYVFVSFYEMHDGVKTW